MPVLKFGDRTEVHTEVVSNKSDLEDKLKLLWESSCLRSSKDSYSSSFARIVGLDTEMTFGSIMDSKLATLQLSTGSHCIIVQLPRMESIPVCLQNFLALPDITFVGVGIKDCISRLVKEYGLVCRNFVELSPFAASVKKDPKLGAYGLMDLVENLRIFGVVEKRVVEKPWSVLTSDWGNVELSEEQIECAAFDAFASFSAGRRLLY